MLRWDGLRNARDLGGLPLTNGGTTRFGKLARSDHPGKLSPLGWEQLIDCGVRAIVSLETGGLSGRDAEKANRPVVPPVGAHLDVMRLAVEDGADQEFMDRWARTGLWGTPLYFADALQRWPHLFGGVVVAICAAPPMVLMHCGRGHDRTGLAAVVVLHLIEATIDGIVADYLLSAQNLVVEDPAAESSLQDALAEAGVTAHDAISAATDVMDADWQSRAGLTDTIVAALKQRLVGASTG